MRSDPLYKTLQQGGFFTGQSLKKPEKKESSRSEQALLTVEGMWCGHCCSLIRHLLLYAVPGVQAAWVDYTCDLALVQYDPYQCGTEILCKQISSWGWHARSFEESAVSSEKSSRDRGKKWKLFLMSALSLQIMMLAYPGYMRDLGYMIDGDLKAFMRLSWLLVIPIFLWMWPSMIRKTFFSLRSLIDAFFELHLKKMETALRALSSIETLALVSTFSAAILSFTSLIRVELYGLPSEGLYLETAAFILTYLGWSDWILSSFKARFLQKVLKQACQEKERIRRKDPHGRWYYESLSSLKKGECFWAIQMDSILCDAQVISGNAWLDRSWRIGESKACFIQQGDLVYSGDILIRGAIELKSTSSPKESYHARLKAHLNRLVQSRPQQPVQLTWRVLQYFVPLLVMLSIVSFFVVWHLSSDLFIAGKRALAILCIGCPCALSLAEPILDQGLVSFFKTKMNAQLLSPERFRFYGQQLTVSKKKKGQDFYLFDKTGTLTTGQLAIETCHLDSHLFGIALTMAQNSQHPLAHSLSSFSSKAPLLPCRQFYEVPGAGLLAEMELEKKSSFFFLGSLPWMRERLKEFVQEALDGPNLKTTHTALFQLSLPFFKHLSPKTQVSVDEATEVDCTCKLLGWVEFKEKIRETSKKLIEELGEAKCQILSGDERESVVSVAKELNITSFRFGCSPMDKALYISDLKSRVGGRNLAVMMVGDGINDSIALAKSDLGVVVTHSRLQALGSLYCADLQIPEQHLSQLPLVPSLAQRARSLCWSNIVSASIYNLIAIFLAMTGRLSPVFSAIAMVLSSIALVANTSKIYLYKKRWHVQSFF